MKKALEKYWDKKISVDELFQARNALQETAWNDQSKAGINSIALDGTLYDQVLDIQHALGLTPKRFEGLKDLDR